MLLTRVRPSLYIPAWVVIWSCISASTAATHNFGQLIAVRFLLGTAEAPYFPAAVYLLSCWYTRRELAVRTAILYSGLILATAFSGLIAAGVFAGLDGVYGLAGWKWLFIIKGAGSFVVAIVAVFILPDFLGVNTGSAKWLLTESERQISRDRMERDRVSEKRIDNSVWTGLAAASKDVKTWIFVSVLTVRSRSDTNMMSGCHAHRQP